MGTKLCGLMLVCCAAFGQSGRIGNGTLIRKEVSFSYETRLEPPVPSLAENVYGTNVIATDANDFGLHRIMIDRSRKVYFGYDVLVEPIGTPTTSFRVTFRQLSFTPERYAEVVKRLRIEIPSNFTLLPLPAPPPPQMVAPGDVIALDLLVNNTTGQKIVDYVTIQDAPRNAGTFNPDPGREFSYASGAARDATAEDLPLRLKAPRLRINGKLDESSTRVNTDLTGSAVWIYVGRRGRFVLSLVPHKELGFQKAGEVRGSSLSFTIGADKFVVDCGGRVGPGEAAYNLYVLHDPAWRPTYAHADEGAFNMGAADRPEMLVRK